MGLFDVMNTLQKQWYSELVAIGILRKIKRLQKLPRRRCKHAGCKVRTAMRAFVPANTAIVPVCRIHARS